MQIIPQTNLSIEKFKHTLCTGIFLFFFHICLAQQPPYSFRHISPFEGLLHNDVKSIAQDAKGFIWILTPNGLQRHDGNRFVNYPYDLTNPKGIKDTRNSNLFSDTVNNCLWITTPYFQKFDLRSNQFTTYAIDNIVKDPQFVLQPYRGPSNRDWLVGDFGVFEQDPQSKTLLSSPNALSIPALTGHKSSNSIIDPKTGNIWMVSFWSGLSLFHKDRKEVFTHSYNPLKDELLMAMSKSNLIAILADSEGDIWMGTNESVFYRWNRKQKKLFSYSLDDIKPGRHPSNSATTKSVICFYEDSHHTIWAGTENAGLLQYNREKDSFLTIQDNETSSDGLHYNYAIRTIFQDREENIWLGTDKGINVFNPYQQYFQSVRHEESNPLSLPKSEINCVIQAPNGDILCGSWGGGITVFDSNWHFQKNIRFDKPFEYDLVWSFIQAEDGKIWAGSQHGYIHVYDPLTQKVEVTFQPPETDSMTIMCMAKDKRGNIWMGLHDGKIAKWDKIKRSFYPYNNQTEGLSQVFAPVLNIFFDKRGQCWVSTSYGFKQFDTERRIYSAVYLPDSNNRHSITAFQSEGVEEYDDSTLIIGTANGGLNLFHLRTKRFTRIMTGDGLAEGSVHALKKDDNNQLWFTTDFGLFTFQCGTNNIVRYHTQPGTITSSFRSTAFYPLQNGRWVILTFSEIISFNPKKNVRPYTPDSRVEITGFRVFNSLLPIDSLLGTKQPVHLRYAQNFITIEFAFLRYFNLQQNKYYYKLDGVDENWVPADTKNFATYTNLSPGEYIFSVKAGNGNNTTNSTSFTIVIDPPFWRTVWFYLLIVTAVVALIISFIRWREKSIIKVQAEKTKVQRLSAEHFKNQLELEQIVNYFSSSLIGRHTVDDVLWDLAKNLIGRMGFVDCMIYLWNKDKTKMVQRAGYGPKGSIEEIEKNLFDVLPGQGVVGYVMQTKEPVLITDTSKDLRYRADEMVRLSEITVPVVHNNELIGVIDCEHPDKNFFTQQHLQVLNTIAALIGTKIKSIESEQSLLQTRIEMLGINEKLSEAKLEALRSQLNPHFIFNCLNSIDDLIQNNETQKATEYLAKFARLIRNILENSNSNVIPCWKDIETLKVYIELEELRCDNSFTFNIDVAGEVLSGDYKVPPLVIQPFVENAIQHGLLNKKEQNKQLMISVSIQNNNLRYEIEDNGVGRKMSAAYNKLNTYVHQSIGMQLTIDRINLFNRKNSGGVIITDLYDKHNDPIGTRVEVNLIN